MGEGVRNGSGSQRQLYEQPVLMGMTITINFGNYEPWLMPEATLQGSFG